MSLSLNQDKLFTLFNVDASNACFSPSALNEDIEITENDLNLFLKRNTAFFVPVKNDTETEACYSSNIDIVMNLILHFLQLESNTTEGDFYFDYERKNNSYNVVYLFNSMEVEKCTIYCQKIEQILNEHAEYYKIWKDNIPIVYLVKRVYDSSRYLSNLELRLKEFLLCSTFHPLSSSKLQDPPKYSNEDESLETLIEEWKHSTSIDLIIYTLGRLLSVVNMTENDDLLRKLVRICIEKIALFIEIDFQVSFVISFHLVLLKCILNKIKDWPEPLNEIMDKMHHSFRNHVEIRLQKKLVEDLILMRPNKS